MNTRRQQGNDNRRKPSTPVPASMRPNPRPASSRSEVRRRLPALWLPILPMALLCGLSFLPRTSSNLALAGSLWATAAGLIFFLLLLRRRVARLGRILSYEIALRKVHYVQLVMQLCVYVYWGWYWREVYRFAPLIVAQLAFAYALDMLICWWRRDQWILGFGAFPIILSTNLFLWFRDDWFFLQFLMIATGVLGKEFLKWKREGRLVHIFNPSALSLFIFSIALIATGTTRITWGMEIAATLHRPPHIYVEIFLLGLVVQALFNVTLVTLCAAAMLVVLNFLYTHFTGVYHFVDTNIPVAVFLGLHLLVTDPATSPRRNMGKVIFGALYGAGVFVAYGALSWFGAPEFYDKLLCVPILNLGVRLLDRASEVIGARLQPALLPAAAWRLGRRWNPRWSNFAHMGVWASLFAVIMVIGFLKKGKGFPGGNSAFWRKACESHRWNACKTWVRILGDDCQDGFGEACFTLGTVMNEGRVVSRNAKVAGVSLGRSCDLGIRQACTRLVEFAHGEGKDVFQRACDDGDGASCFILGSLYSSGLGVPQDDTRAFILFQKSCSDQWWRGCGRLGTSYLVGQGTKPDPEQAAENFEKGCHGSNAASCLEMAKLYHSGVGGQRSDVLARDRLQQACDLGLLVACQQLETPVISGSSMARP